MAKEDKDIEKEVDPENTEDVLEPETEEADEAKSQEEVQTSDSEEASEESEDDGEQAEDGQQQKKSFFKGKKEKKDKKDAQIEELNDRLMRQMAEFDNFRKRTDKEKKQMFEVGAGEVIEKILPVVDNFERGLGAMTEEDKASSFAQGMEMIYKQLTTVLEGVGVSPIEAEGKEFDPMLHNAVMQSPSEDYDSGIIIQELQKGYMYKEKVLRHSMVIVAE